MWWDLCLVGWLQRAGHVGVALPGWWLERGAQTGRDSHLRDVGLILRTRTGHGGCRAWEVGDTYILVLLSGWVGGWL